MSWRKAVGLFVLLLGTIGTIIGLELASRPLFFPSSAIAMAAVFSLANDGISVETWNIPGSVQGRHGKALDSTIFSLLSAGTLINSQHTQGVPDIVYWVVALSAGAIVLRILLKPSLIVLVQIVLLSFLLRASTWFSAPIIGTDPRLHQALIGYVAHTHELIPVSISYYHHYPVAHVWGAEIMFLGDMDAKAATFLAITGGSIIGIAIIYTLLERLIEGRKGRSRAALFAALFVATVPSHVAKGGLPYTQTLGLGLVPLVLYSVYRSNDVRFRLLAIFSTIPVVFTHNLTPALLFTLLFFISFAGIVSQRMEGQSGEVTNFGISLVFIGLLTTIHYYIVIDYFGLQISRLSTIFLGGQSISGDVSTSLFGSSGAFTIQDPFLHLGSGLYVVAAAFVFVLIDDADSIQHGAIPYRQYAWYAGVGVIFAISGAAIAAGGSEVTFRTLPFLMLVAAIVIGSACDRLATSTIGRLALVVMLLVSPALAVVAAENGVRNPGVSPTNRVQDVTVDMQRDELAAANFATNRRANTRMDAYVHSSMVFKRLGERQVTLQTNEMDIQSRIDSFGSISELTRGSLTNCSSTTLYRERYRSFPGLNPPLNSSAIYDSGSARLYNC